MKLHVNTMNNSIALLLSLTLLALPTGARVTKKTESIVTSQVVPIVTTNNTGSVATSNTGPKVTTNTGPVSTNKIGPEVTTNTGPVTTSKNGPEVTTNTGPVTTSNTGPKVTTNTGPVVTTNTGPVTTSKNGPEVTSSTRPEVTNNTVPEVTGNTGIIVINNTGPIIKITSVMGSISAQQTKTGGPTWGYGVSGTEVYGPDEWGKMSVQCKGTTQSPIDIFPQATPFKVASKPMSMESDNTLGLVTGILTNTGRATQFTVNEKEGTVFLSGGPADSGTYKLTSIQFHVGCMDGSGSEHTFNSKPASAEMQMIFYNKKYKNINEAVSQPDGVTIIATLFDYYGGYTYYINPTLERLVSFLPNITEPDSSVPLDYDERIELTKLIPDLTQPNPLYYTYKGSLTTPPCYESVTWILLKTRLSISIQQLAQFRQLQGRDGSQLCDNFRPIQPTNTREVTRNFL